VKAIEHGFSVQFYSFDELLVALRADACVRPSHLRRKRHLNTPLPVIRKRL
jgi:hypothetical protein